MKTSEMILQAMSEIASRQFAEAYNTLSLAYDEAKKAEFRNLAHGIRDAANVNDYLIHCEKDSAC